MNIPIVVCDDMPQTKIYLGYNPQVVNVKFREKERRENEVVYEITTTIKRRKDQGIWVNVSPVE